MQEPPSEIRPAEIRPGTPPPGPPVPPGPPPEEGIFALRRKFPGEGSLAPGPAPAVESSGPAISKSKVLTRVVLPLVLLVVVVGGIAYVAQNLPRWRTPDRKVAKSGDRAEVLRFPQLVAVWDGGNAVADVERGNPGPGRLDELGPRHYDFYFENPSDAPAEIGVAKTACDCSHVQVALLSSHEVAGLDGKHDRDSLARVLSSSVSWQAVEKDERLEKGVTVPGQSKGLVRVGWDVRKPEWEALNLDVHLWTRPKVEAEAGPNFLVIFGILVLTAAAFVVAWWVTSRGKLLLGAVAVAALTFFVGVYSIFAARARERLPATQVTLKTPARVVPAVMFDQNEIQPPDLTGPTTQASFMCWSATRDQLDLALAPGANDGVFEWKISPPLSAEECRNLLAQLKRNTRVKAAHRVSLTVHESRNGAHVAMGSFTLRPPLVLDGNALSTPGPLISISVRGDVDIEDGDVRGQGRLHRDEEPGTVERNQIQFRQFKSRRGAGALLELRADPQMQLKVVERKDYPRGADLPPPYIKLGRLVDTQQFMQDKKIWQLEVALMPGVVPAGSLPASAAVLLSAGRPVYVPWLGERSSSRQLRISIVGHASPD